MVVDRRAVYTDSKFLFCPFWHGQIRDSVGRLLQARAGEDQARTRRGQASARMQGSVRVRRECNRKLGKVKVTNT